MLKIALIVTFFVTAMFAVKETAVLQTAGLFNSCSAALGPGSDETPLQACRPGKLDGRPDLSLKSCTSRGLVGDVEYWTCPAPLIGGFKP